MSVGGAMPGIPMPGGGGGGMPMPPDPSQLMQSLPRPPMPGKSGGPPPGMQSGGGQMPPGMSMLPGMGGGGGKGGAMPPGGPQGAPQGDPTSPLDPTGMQEGTTSPAPKGAKGGAMPGQPQMDPQLLMRALSGQLGQLGQAPGRLANRMRGGGGGRY